MPINIESMAGGLSSRAKAVAVSLSGEGPLRASAIVLERAMKQELSKPGSGRVYVRRSIAHQASAPGEPPAVDTGQGRASIGREERYDGGTFVIRVGSDLRKMAALNFGHDFGTYVLLPRPWAEPALRAARKEMSGALVAELQRQGRKV